MVVEEEEVVCSAHSRFRALAGRLCLHQPLIFLVSFLFLLLCWLSILVSQEAKPDRWGARQAEVGGPRGQDGLKSQIGSVAPATLACPRVFQAPERHSKSLTESVRALKGVTVVSIRGVIN